MISMEEVDQMIERWKAAGLSGAEIICRTANACLGWPYVFGAWGEKCTPSGRRKRKRADHPTIVSKCPVLNGSEPSCATCNWGIGVRMYDCRGFTRWLLQQVGIELEGQGATSQWNTEKNWTVRGEIRDLPKDRVACVFRQDKDGKTMNHTGMHIGDGKIIHCSSGVQTGKITQRGWTHFAIPIGLYEEGELPPAPVYRPTLKRGCKGDAVVQLQEILDGLGYDLGPCGIDGNFGRKTRAAVKAFQADRGLKADGIVGVMTWAELMTDDKEG